MTEKQKMFADAYLADPERNAARAYQSVYGTKSSVSASKLASRLMKNEGIRAYIDERLEQIHSEKTADIREVQEYLTAVMRGQTSSATLAFVGGSQQAVVMKPPEEKDRLKAAELLGRTNGMFRDRVGVEMVVPSFSGDDNLED